VSSASPWLACRSVRSVFKFSVRDAPGWLNCSEHCPYGASGKLRAPLREAARLIVKSGSYAKTGANLADLSVIRYSNIGTTYLRTGVLRLPNDLHNAGMLIGTGTVAANSLTNHGHVAPGESPGALTVNGHCAQSSTGMLDMELQSPTSFDLPIVNGTANLGGTLNLICFANCSFAIVRSFTVLNADAGKLNGTFADVA